MKHQLGLDGLYTFLEKRNRFVTQQQQKQFSIFVNLLEKWSQKQNLVSKNDIPHLIERHFLPSLFLCDCLPDSIDGQVIDIGTGGGFPGIILKIMRPDLSLTLLDSSHKKILFLHEVCEHMEIYCPLVCARSEIYQHQVHEFYKIAVSRAVAKLDVLWRWTFHMMSSNSRLYVLKGGNYQQEIDELNHESCSVDIRLPDREWMEFSNYMYNKCVIILEK